MALILNIETSTEVCSVSLALKGKTLHILESADGLNHSSVLTVFIENILAENRIPASRLGAVAVSKGPGSYTGLRIGVSVAKGICYGLNIPLISVDSLEILGKYAAQNHNKYKLENGDEPALFCPMIDARRMEVYTALYNSKGESIRPVTAEIINGDFLADQLAKHKILFFGNGAEKCKQLITHHNAIFGGPQTTSAEFMQQISENRFRDNQFEDIVYFEPFYLKNFVATIPKNKVL